MLLLLCLKHEQTVVHISIVMSPWGKRAKYDEAKERIRKKNIKEEKQIQKKKKERKNDERNRYSRSITKLLKATANLVEFGYQSLFKYLYVFSSLFLFLLLSLFSFLFLFPLSSSLILFFSFFPIFFFLLQFLVSLFLFLFSHSLSFIPFSPIFFPFMHSFHSFIFIHFIIEPHETAGCRCEARWRTSCAFIMTFLSLSTKTWAFPSTNSRKTRPNFAARFLSPLSFSSFFNFFLIFLGFFWGFF